MSAFDNILELDAKKSGDNSNQTPLDIIQELKDALNRQLGKSGYLDHKTFTNRAHFDYGSSTVLNKVRHSISITIEKLKITIELLTIEHDILRFYPVKLNPNRDILEYQEQLIADDKEQLVEQLGYFFKEDLVKTAISTLLAQA